MAQACNPSTREAQAGRLRVPSHDGYQVRPCLKKKARKEDQNY
jgi:hypothetical protein